MAIMEAYCKKRCRHSTYQRRLFSRIKGYHYKCLALNPWDRPTARQIADYTSQHINGSPVPFSLSNNSHDTLQEEEDKTHEDSISAHSSDINKMSPYQDKGKRKKL